MSDEVLHKGGCHCRRVQYQVHAPATLHCIECNCTICNMKQNVHFIVPATKFQLLSGEEFLTTYTFNTHQANHKFCKVCGVQSFYIPRSNPDGVGIMPHCLDQTSVKEIIVQKFDGSKWEQAMKSDQGQKISEFSKE